MLYNNITVYCFYLGLNSVPLYLRHATRDIGDFYSLFFHCPNLCLSWN